MKWSDTVTFKDSYWYWSCWWPGEMLSLSPVLLLWHDTVARVLANRSAAFLKAALPLAERLATSSDHCSETGPRSSACLVLTWSQSCEVNWDCHLYGQLLISSLLMTWWHTEPGHQQAWYWPSLRVVKWSEMVTCMDTVTNIKPADDLVTYWTRSPAGLILTQSQVEKRSEIVTWIEGYWYQACWGHGEILSLVISRLDIDLVSCEVKRDGHLYGHGY